MMKLQQMVLVGCMLVASQMVAAEGYDVSDVRAGQAKSEDASKSKEEAIFESVSDFAHKDQYKLVLAELIAKRLSSMNRAQWQERCAALPLNTDSLYSYPAVYQYAEPYLINRRFGYIAPFTEQQQRKYFCGLYHDGADLFDASDSVKKHAAQEFIRAVRVCTQLQEAAVANPVSWLAGQVVEWGKQRYVQRLQISDSQKFAVLGDMHGAVSSLHVNLQRLEAEGILEEGTYKIKDPNYILLCTGDYTDRGGYGVEAVYTLARLKEANPGQVILIRGNHEDWRMAAGYGFSAELEAKFTVSTDGTTTKEPSEGDESKSDTCTCYEQAKITMKNFYDRLPSALFVQFLNKKGLLFCHGGLPITLEAELVEDASGRLRRILVPRYQHMPNALLAASAEIQQEALPLLKEGESCMYEWTDISLDGQDQADQWSGRDKLSQATIETFYEEADLDGMIRAHQHSHFKEDEIMMQIYDHKGCAPHFINESDAKRILSAISKMPTGEHEHELAVSRTRTLGVFSDSWVGAHQEVAFEGILLLHLKGSYEESMQKILWTHHEQLAQNLAVIKSLKKQHEDEREGLRWRSGYW